MNILPAPDIVFNIMLIPVFTLVGLLLTDSIRKDDILKLFTVLLITPLLLSPLALTIATNGIAIALHFIFVKRTLSLTRVLTKTVGITDEMVRLGNWHRRLAFLISLVSATLGTHYIYTLEFTGLSAFLTVIVFLNLILVYCYMTESTDDFILRAKRDWFL